MSTSEGIKLLAAVKARLMANKKHDWRFWQDVELANTLSSLSFSSGAIRWRLLDRATRIQSIRTRVEWEQWNKRDTELKILQYKSEGYDALQKEADRESICA